MNWFKFTACAGTDLFTCPGGMLKAQFNQMTKANCLNCDKFFHCQRNYDAVYRCGNSAKNQRIAEKISNCREQAQDDGSEDSQADQQANKFGRDGGNCRAQYTCKVKCKYNPQNKTCRKSNCP
ncbi:unnamed protein product [Adineta steineri]|uniref:Uncharacterized protein n=1 Tax=Adineta steineri TaxID=433720 RepID=A0A814PAG9_9BILA|nr:unnamed protein product [Adineta steineri]CAF1102672.1 unnamed protein product [Adineta steineri]